MKKKWLLFVALSVNLLTLQNCSDDPQSPTGRVRALLGSGAWKLNTVMVDGLNKTDVYSGLTLTFTEDNIAVANGKEVWPKDMTWKFTDDTGGSIERQDGLQITVTDVSETSLVLKLNWESTIFRGGRGTSVAGIHTFSFAH